MRFLKNKRALSPIIAAVLMIVLIMAAIALALGFITPNITKFKDKSYNNSVRMYLISLDSVVKGLVNEQAPSSKIFYYYQQEGTFGVIADWEAFFFLKDITGSPVYMLFHENITRIKHVSTYVSNYKVGEHRYLMGPENQDYLMLNGSSKLYNDIAVLNESRVIFAPGYLEQALYYRYKIDTDYITIGNSEIYSMKIYHLRLISNTSKVSYSMRSISLALSYNGTTTYSFARMSFNHDMETYLQLVGQYGHFYYEYPVYFPINSNFSSHFIDVKLINIDVIISIVGE